MRASLLLQLLLPFALSGQTIWAPLGARWTYLTEFGQPPWTGGYGSYTITAAGDTMINGRTCSVLDLPSGLDCGFPGVWTVLTQVYTYSSGDSVFWYNPYSDSFDLLFAFDVHANDQWRIPFAIDLGDVWLFDTLTYTVSALDTVSISGTLARRITYGLTAQGTIFAVSSQGQIVERLGDLAYMFPWRYNGCSDGTFEGPLLCYSDPNFNWPVPEVPCDIWLGSADHRRPELKIFPTVIERGGSITVSMKDLLPSAFEIEILDPLGRLIRAQTANTPVTYMAIDQPGAFVLVARSEKGILGVQRIVVH